MNDWLSYRLSDFVMFSARVYDRQIELHNQQFAGLQFLSMALGLAVLWMCGRPSSAAQRVLPVVLGLGWVWVGWSFLWRRYAEINLLAEYAAPAFALQGIGLLALGLTGKGLDIRLPAGLSRYLVLAVIAVPVLAYPLFAPLFGKPVSTSGYFLLMPDPTALASLLVLAFSALRLRWFLMVAPAIWCALSALMLSTLDLPDAWVLAAGLAVFAVAAVSALRMRSGP
jgi:hypothetical protein